MGSKLEVASVYGKGSEFSFKLKQRIIDRNSIGDYEHHIKISDSKSDQKYLTAAGAKILAVDDNETNLKVISGLLKRSKISVEVADSGQQCIEFAKKNFYNVIFLDNMMPVMNGVETLKILQNEKILSSDTKVVMLTASALAGMRETYLSEGFDDYLSKPIDVLELEKILERNLPAEIVSFENENTDAENIQADSEPVTSLENSASENTIAETSENVQTDSETVTDSDESLINFELGMEYNAGMEDLYKEILLTFYRIKDEKIQKLQESFDAEDWKNYTIYVHSLKSTALSIGGEKTSKAAEKLEKAGKVLTSPETSETEKQQSADFIKQNHAAAIKLYEKLADAAQKLAETL